MIAFVQMACAAAIFYMNSGSLFTVFFQILAPNGNVRRPSVLSFLPKQVTTQPFSVCSRRIRTGLHTPHNLVCHHQWYPQAYHRRRMAPVEYRQHQTFSVMSLVLRHLLEPSFRRSLALACHRVPPLAHHQLQVRLDRIPNLKNSFYPIDRWNYRTLELIGFKLYSILLFSLSLTLSICVCVCVCVFLWFA